MTPPEEQLTVIQTYLREHGSGRRQDFLRLLNVSPAQGTQILRRLTARGELLLTGRRYTLPQGNKQVTIAGIISSILSYKNLAILRFSYVPTESIYKMGGVLLK